MRRLSTRYITITCPDCKEPAHKTAWLPPEGYDSHLRQFRCSKCEWEIYVEIATEMTRTAELALLGKE